MGLLFLSDIADNSATVVVFRRFQPINFRTHTRHATILHDIKLLLHAHQLRRHGFNFRNANENSGDNRTCGDLWDRYMLLLHFKVKLLYVSDTKAAS